MKRHAVPRPVRSAIKKPAIRTPESPEAVEALKLWGPYGKAEKHGIVNTQIIRQLIIRDHNGNRKGLVAIQGLKNVPNVWTFIYYPKKEHFWIFDKANALVEHRDSSILFRGSVGSAQVEIMDVFLNEVNEPPVRKKCLTINSLQGQFIQGKPPELTRSLATQYGGWRTRLLDQIFNFAEVDGLPVSFYSPMRESAPHTKNQDREKFFIEYAEKRGYVVQRFPSDLIAEKIKK